MKRFTVSIDDRLANRIPHGNRSAFINNLLEKHFHLDEDAQYDALVERLKDDGYIAEPSHTGRSYTLKTLAERNHERACCSRYPDKECGHWIKESETDQLRNLKTNEVIDL